jgi:GrpB-like predicted nucleotidyltransferase (UPF0157 family)
MVGRVGAPELLNAPVLLVEADPTWPSTAARLLADIRAALGDRVLLAEHAGSTSVPGLAAKPVIDLVLAVADPADEESYVDALTARGYTLRVREPDWHEHRMLRLDEPRVNLHVFALGSVEIDRMLGFQEDIVARATRRTALPVVGVHVLLDEDDARAAPLAHLLGLPLLDVRTLRTAGVDPDVVPGALAGVAAGCPASVLVGDVPTDGLAGRVVRVSDLPPLGMVDELARAVRQLAR